MAEIVAGANTAIDDSTPGVLKIDVFKGVELQQILRWNGSGYPAKSPLVPLAVYRGPVDPESLGITLGSGDTWEDSTSLYVKLAANVANATTTLAESGLSVPVKAGVTYDIEAKIHYDSSIATSNASGVKWGISGPAASLISVEEHHTGNPNGTTFWHFRGAYGVSTPASNNSALNGNMATFVGALTPTADGDFKIQFAPNVASQTITLLPASRMRLTPIR